MDDAEFWSELFGSTEFTYSWWRRVKYQGDASWEKPGIVELTIEDPENEGYLTKALSLADLVTAYNAIASDPNYPDMNIENMDEDSADLVFQYVMLGDVVFG
jgi:hypothetical protein